MAHKEPQMDLGANSVKTFLGGLFTDSKFSQVKKKSQNSFCLVIVAWRKEGRIDLDCDYHQNMRSLQDIDESTRWGSHVGKLTLR